ncbi:MAG: GTPase HflX [Firmicutes bacterium]|nr:GTPase HflX [Bacillota bacterium]
MKVLIVGVTFGNEDKNNSMDELASLVWTAGGFVVGMVEQNRVKVDAEFFVGSGKVREIREFAESNEAELIVFNNQLSGRQIKNLVDEINISVIDRNMLILDIFAMRAQNQEGKLQVELAQLNYSLPRLIGQGVLMDRQEGAIGTRGPGETKLELDRRVIRRKITEKKREIDKLTKQREGRRKKRMESEKNVAIVGYTNAGKSTLMNSFTKAGVEVEDKLFATLDTTTRKVFHEIGKEYTLTDTVGFISDLPHEFIKAFKSTLEEAKYADLLLLVVDISSEQIEKDVQVVMNVLEELNVSNKTTIVVFNKIDALRKIFEIKDNDLMEEKLNEKTSGIEEIKRFEKVFISAKKGEGIDELKQAIVKNLWG